jgi:DNA-binding response OmpR family regulator
MACSLTRHASAAVVQVKHPEMNTVPHPLTPTRERILVVDDEPQIRTLIGRALAEAGYSADLAGDGDAALTLAATQRYAMAILDLMMPGLDGQATLARLRERRLDLPVLMLSCVDDVQAKVRCLELGAQDYLTKPFSLAELLARVRVQLRGPARSGIIHSGDLALDLSRLQADAGNGPVALTRLEFLLLRELIEHEGQSVPKDELLASIWGIDFDPGSNVVDVCVGRLRSKLGYSLIRTVRGAGYQLAG